MATTVKKSDLRKYISRRLFEYTVSNYSSLADKPMPEEEQPGSPESTVPQEVPLRPVELASSQLADERPPIEDPEYIPSSVSELSKSAKVIASLVPKDQVEAFYLAMHKLLDDSVEDSRIGKDQSFENEKLKKLDDETRSSDDVKEEALRLAVRQILEAHPSRPLYGYDPDDEDFGDLAVMKSHSVEAPPEDEELNRDSSKDGVGYEELAKSPFSKAKGASGARQEELRLLQRLRFLSDKVKPKDLDSLRAFATSQFINTLRDNDYIDDDDVEELRQDRQELQNTDTFRSFYVEAIILPAYQEIKRTARKNIESELESLDIPKGAWQTIINQAFKEADVDKKAVMKKIQKVDPENYMQKTRDVRMNWAKLMKMGEMEGDFVAIARARWDKRSRNAKADRLKKSLESAQEYMDLVDSGAE